MLTAIERKFLVKHHSWRDDVIKMERLRDGLVATTDGRKVRVRIYSDRSTITIKTRNENGDKGEFEYEIPKNDAEEIIKNHCGGYRLDKTRYYVDYKDFMWEVDVYDGLLKGLIIAEIKLANINDDLPMPQWVGREVTGDSNYKKLNMLKRKLENDSSIDLLFL
jgi:CYTH domain-containing protein